MTTSFTQSLFFLLAGVAIVILLTARYRVPAFFALLIASFVVGFGVHLPFASIITVIREGFGRIMQSLAFIIILGTTLGVLLEHTGCTRVMARTIMRKTGERRAPLAMSLTGFIVGLPVFCDSGYIVLSGLNRSLAARSGSSIIALSVSLATGLYVVHCLVPPHPGASSAAGTLGIDLGKLIFFGTLVAIPGMIVGHLWALYAAKKVKFKGPPEEDSTTSIVGPPTVIAFLPVIVPIVLIATNSFLNLEHNEGIVRTSFAVLGEPVIALSIGVILTLMTRKWRGGELSRLLQESIEKSGGVLVIIGAGGAFGAVLAAAKIGEQFSSTLDLNSLGILFPFLLTFVLKTAQGSSTVAIITAASIVLPLLPSLGLDHEKGRLLSVLSMGAGSMMISHANDAYFWVISKFSGLDMKTMLKTYSVATIITGLVTLLSVFILSLFI